MADEKSSGQVLSENYRRATGLPERESDAPVTDVEVGDDYDADAFEATQLNNLTEPEGGYGGDPERTMGLNQPYERRPSTEEHEIVEGPPNPPEGKAHNMSSGQWDAAAHEGAVVGETEGLSVSPIPTDNPATGVAEGPDTPAPDGDAQS